MQIPLSWNMFALQYFWKVIKQPYQNLQKLLKVLCLFEPLGTLEQLLEVINLLERLKYAAGLLHSSSLCNLLIRHITED